MFDFYDKLIYCCIYSCRKFLEQIEKEKALFSSSKPKLLNGGGK